jgi:muramoyltetrapeptide carboxypeptidase
MSAPAILFPPRFAEGDTIGIAAPASPPEKPEVIDQAAERLTALGFRVKLAKFLRKRDGYLAGSDEERAADINALFADPTVKAVLALRGGYGSCRILPLLDYEVIRANPKPFIGYSDITAMQLAIFAKTGLVTFHGSNASSAFEPENIAGFQRMLVGGGSAPFGETSNSSGMILFSRDDGASSSLETIVTGRVTGRLLGGNMTCFLRLLATPFLPDLKGAILFLEDTGEKAYRIDGMFTHLRLAGVLSQIRGLVLGRFDHSDAQEQGRINTCLRREAERIEVPCISGAPIGHFVEQIIVPQGVLADLDATGASLSIRPS